MDDALKNVWVIMPVYNEEAALPHVLNEWIPTFRKHFESDYTFCILNDGSSDSTRSILEQYAPQYAELSIVDKKNTGHGQSCIQGYQLALEQGAEWIFQIDSDGQCDANYFAQLLVLASKKEAVYGNRKKRADGIQRTLVSKFVTLFVWAATGTWIKDANVPYRLMHKSHLMGFLQSIPQDFHLCNILVSIHQKKNFGIRWVNIFFRDRMGGKASVKTFSFIKHGLTLFRSLRKFKKENAI